MNCMRSSGNEPSSMILSQTKWFQKLKMMARKCLKGEKISLEESTTQEISRAFKKTIEIVFAELL